MKHYKKRTIALCLASVLTVVGAFGAENFKNSLMSIRINSGSNGHISITAFTEKPFESNIRTAQVNPNEFILTLPETNNSTVAPMVAGYQNISDIKIVTFPYTRENDGYTQIIIKTIGSPSIKTNTMLFIPSGINNETTAQQPNSTYYPNQISNYNDYNNNESNNLPQSQYNTNNSSTNYQTQPPRETIKPANSKPNNYAEAQENNSPLHSAIALFWILVLILIIGIIYILSRDKMDSVIGGGHNDFDLDLDNDKSKNKKINNTKKTANNPKKSSVKKTISTDFSNIGLETPGFPTEEKHNEEPEEETVVLDLDSLFKEKTQQDVPEPISEGPKEPEEPEEDDLAAFLSDFAFEEEAPNDENTEEESTEEIYNEELYENVINNSKFKFSSNDMKKISQLIQIEITPDTIDRLKKLAEDIKNKPKPLTPKQILENILTTYSIKQNISFTHEDVDAIKKLMSVELDESFITDLRTKPERVKEVQKEIEKRKISHKTSEIITMKVKDLLPDLSKELQKQGNKEIKSEVKPQVVYFSEGYEVSKFSTPDDLAILTQQLQTQDFTEEFKPSYSAPIVESGYEYITLTTGNDLPDLADVKAHPDKYKEKEKVREVADEDVLLKNISNVTFKPFYEEPEEPEMPLEPEEPEKPEEPITITENIETIKTFETEKEPEVIEKPIIITKKPLPTRKNKTNDEAQKLLQLIEEQQIQRELKQKQYAEEQSLFKKELENSAKKEKSQPKKPEVQKTDNNIPVMDSIIKTVKCDSNFSCHLLKTKEGYEIVGCTRNNQVNLKHYNELKSSNMQVRINDKLPDGKIQYLIKIGIQKFVVNVINDNMEFVMDLC